jgi:hypothetical protein
LIKEKAFRQCTSLLHINIPSTVNSLVRNAFFDCEILRNVVIAPSSALMQDVFMQSFPSMQNKGFSLKMIKGRFDEMPLHRHCYYYHPQHHIGQSLDSITWKWFYEEVSKLPAHGL